MNLKYSRSGGPAPQDDEFLEIAESGAFNLRRVIALGSVGRFAGTLPAEAVAELTALADAAANDTVAEPATRMPNQVRESLRVGDHEWHFVAEAELPAALGELAAFGRGLTEELTDEPVAALGLTLEEDASGGVLAVRGDGPVHADFSAAVAEYSLFGEEQDYLSSGEVSLELPGSTGELDAGWTFTFALPADLDFNPQKTLQVRFTFRMKYDDGIWRDAQITAVAGKGWF